MNKELSMVNCLLSLLSFLREPPRVLRALRGKKNTPACNDAAEVTEREERQRSAHHRLR